MERESEFAIKIMLAVIEPLEFTEQICCVGSVFRSLLVDIHFDDPARRRALLADICRLLAMDDDDFAAAAKKLGVEPP